MMRILFAFIVIWSLSSVAALAQPTTPQPKRPTEQRIQPLVWSMQLDGSYLGVELQEVTKDNYSQFGLRDVRGVAIKKVLENSPAARAGLQDGDVILRFNGEEVTSVRKLTRLISEVAPDHAVRLTVSRAGSEREVSATMGKREMPRIFEGNFRMDDFPAMPQIPEVLKETLPRIGPLGQMKLGDADTFVWTTSSRQIGVTVLSLTRQLGDYFGVPEGKGLLISNVRENSPAAKAGVRAGDVIVEVEGKPVSGNLDLVRAINEKKDGDISLTIIRDKNRQTVRVAPETMKSDLAPLVETSAPETNYR